jgi:hypothetical protein
VYHVLVIPGGEASAEAAAASAARTVLAGLFPANAHTLGLQFENSIADIPDDEVRQRGIDLGQNVGEQILSWRANDHSSDMVPYTPGTNPGDWRPTPPSFSPAMMPQWAIVTPFAMTSGSQFRGAGPPALTSAAYTSDFDEVKSLGAMNSAVRTPEQSEIAMFWMDMPGTATTAGRWNYVAQTVAAQKENTFSDNVQLFALLNIALADAGIAAWDDKYHFNFWRPITAIREADTDGNPGTAPDPMWMPYLMTPAFPEYVSAHSTFSAAAAAVLEYFFGTDNINFTIYDFMMPASGRAYTSFSAAAEEAGRSRIYGGIHFTTANHDGLATGRSIGEYVTQNFLLAEDLLILPAPSIASAGTVFSLDFALLEDITGPVDVYVLADTPYGIFTIFPGRGARVAAGITPIFRNVRNVTAPLAGPVMNPVRIPGGTAAGAYTFYAVTVNAGTMPPVTSLSQLNARTTNVVMFDKETTAVQ